MKRSDDPDGKNLSVFQIQLNQSFSVQGGSQFLVVYSEEIECGLVVGKRRRSINFRVIARSNECIRM